MRWISAGPELTLTLARPEAINRVLFSSDRLASLDPRNFKTTFVGEYRIEVSQDGRTWVQVASSRDRKPSTAAHRRKRLIDAEADPEERRRLDSIDRESADVVRKLEAIKPLPTLWAGVFRRASGPFHVFVGGDPEKKGETVAPSSPSMLAEVAPRYVLESSVPESERRLALAHWIVAPENPLTPRVLANRLWHYHFGTGIVDTPSDFGYMGGRPTHPELLDWLALQVHAHGWRLKPLHRLIVTSQTYRQSATGRPEAMASDAGGRYLWRFPTRRLEGEEVRDAMLAVAGKLDPRVGGPGFRLYRYLEDNVSTYVPLDRHGPETYRRAVYHQNARAARVDLVSDFDAPDCAFAASRRASTTTPLQALTLMNHSFTGDISAFLAERLDRESSGKDAGGQVPRAFLLAFARPPGEEEQAAAASFVRRHGLQAFCRALLNSNEFIYLD